MSEQIASPEDEPSYTLQVTFRDFAKFKALYDELEARISHYSDGLVGAMRDGNPSLMPPEAREWWGLK